MIAWLILGVYGWLCLVAWSSLVLMRRPGKGLTDESKELPLTVLIPARDEARNLDTLIPQLRSQGFQVLVFDDESSDGTAEVAAGHGATVIRPGGSLPEGWTGKNRACHELAKAACECSPADWWVFLDADCRVGDGFRSALQESVRKRGASIPVFSAFPRLVPGAWPEPMFLAWVGWILLATNPFGLVARTGMGHNMFTNGQFSLWRATNYTQIWPHQEVKGDILEDIKIGRLLARKKIRVEVLNLSHCLSVQMYQTWRQALDGMSKNSYEITNSAPGSVLLSLLLVVLGWAWLGLGPLMLSGYGLLCLSGLATALTVRARPWGVFLMPIALCIGGFTILRSLAWHSAGRVQWKGRTY